MVMMLILVSSDNAYSGGTRDGAAGGNDGVFVALRGLPVDSFVCIYGSSPCVCESEAGWRGNSELGGSGGGVLALWFRCTRD